MKYGNTSDRTKMAYYVIYSLLQNEDTEIEDILELQELLQYGIEQCDNLNESQEKIKETKSWYKKALELTTVYTFEELKESINNNADKYSFTK